MLPERSQPLVLRLQEVTNRLTSWGLFFFLPCGHSAMQMEPKVNWLPNLKLNGKTILSPCHLHSCHRRAEVCLTCLGRTAGSYYFLLKPISANGRLLQAQIVARGLNDGEETGTIMATHTKKSHNHTLPLNCFSATE